MKNYKKSNVYKKHYCTISFFNQQIFDLDKFIIRNNFIIINFKIIERTTNLKKNDFKIVLVIFHKININKDYMYANQKIPTRALILSKRFKELDKKNKILKPYKRG